MALGTHSKIAIGWWGGILASVCWSSSHQIVIFRTAITITGITAFLLSKRSIDQKRYDNMKIRERMRKANEGEYTPSSRHFE